MRAVSFLPAEKKGRKMRSGYFAALLGGYSDTVGWGKLSFPYFAGARCCVMG